MHNVLTLLFILLCSSVTAQQPLTLDQAIAIGLQNNYSIRIARTQADIADNNRGLGTAGFLPTLDATAGLNRSRTEQDMNLPPVDGVSDANGWNAEVALNWTLFDGFSMFANRARFRELAELGREQARAQIEAAVVGISQAYFNLVQQEQLLEVARETRDISGERLEREQVRKELGGASSTDLLNAQVAYNADQATLLDQELEVVIARKELNIALGRDPGTDVQVSTDIQVQQVNVELAEAVAMAREDNADLLVARLDKEVADRGVQLARAPFLPRMIAYAKYGYADQTQNSDFGEFADQDVDATSGTTTVGLSLSLNLFNGRRDKIALNNARLDANIQALALRNLENQLAGDVREALETYRRRLTLVELEEQNIEAARQNLSLQQEQYELGATTSLEFRDAQVSVVRAETALIAARYQARIAQLEFDRLLGRVISPEELW